MRITRSIKRILGYTAVASALFVISFMVNGIGVFAAENQGKNPDEITIYYVQDEYSNIIVPDNMAKYKINTEGLEGTPEFRARNGAFVYVSPDGVISPCARNVSIAIATGHTGDMDNIHFTDKIDRLNTYRYAPCYDIVDVTCGDYHEEIAVNVKNYAEVWVDDFIKTTAAELTAGKTSDYDKMEAIVKWTADNTDYSVDYSRLHNMIISKRGDCIANSQVIVAMCKSVGINASLRRSYQDNEFVGNGHINAYVECKKGANAGEYKADMASIHKGRPYEIHKEDGGFSVWEESDSTIYQYDGFDKNITIPDSMYGHAITTLGKVDRFDADGFAPMFYDLAGDKHCNVEQLNIPAGITKINKKALSGASDLKKIEVASANQNYKSVDGALFEKSGKLLYVPPARDSLTINPNDITAVDNSAFDDVKELNIYYGGNEASWNGKNINLPSHVHVFFGTTRVTGITASSYEVDIADRNTTKQLNCSVLPSNAANKNITYKSSDIVVARVDDKGLVTARSAGSCTITATTSDGGYVAEIKVNVTIPGRKVTIIGGAVVSDDVTSSSGIYNESETVSIVATEVEDGYYFKEWKVPDGVELQQETTDSPRATFSMPDKDVTIEAVYSEYLPVKVYGINLDRYLCIESEIQLSVNTYSTSQPNHYKRNITWESSNPDVATVDSNGVLRACGFGNTEISATVKTQQGTVTVGPRFVSVSDHMMDEETSVIVQRTDCLSQPTIIEGTCVNCNKHIRLVIPADGEHWPGTENVKVIKEATCTEPGIAYRRCLVCNTLCEVETEPLGHDWDEGEVVTPATCTEDGVKLCHCKRKDCNASGNLPIKAEGHKWDEGVVTKEPTETEPGEKTYTCTECKETMTKEFYNYNPDNPDNLGPDPVIPNPSVPVTPANPGAAVNPAPAAAATPAATDPGKTASQEDDKYISITAVTSKDIKKNLLVSDTKGKSGKYKITKFTKNKKTGKITGGTVTFEEPFDKTAKTVTIKASVKIAGATFKVTGIEKNAFNDCANTATIKIQSKYLSSIGKNAVAGAADKLTIKLPKAKSKKYKKLIKKSGFGKKKIKYK